MSQDNPQGQPPKIRPNRPTPEILQGILVELDAAADLVEQLLTQGHDDAIFATVIKSLDEMVGLLNGGRHE